MSRSRREQILMATRLAPTVSPDTEFFWRGLRDIRGMNGITEGVRQVRGSCNQVEDVEHVLVTSGTGVPTSALILAPAD